MSPSPQSSPRSSNETILLKNERIVLVRRPNGLPRPHDLRTETVHVPVNASWFAPAPPHTTDNSKKCDLILETLFVSIDPAMRGWMSAAKSYLPPIPLGAVVRASTISRLVAASSGVLQAEYPLGCIVRTEVVGVQSYKILKNCTPQKARKLLTRLDCNNNTNGSWNAPLIPNTRLSYASFLGVLGTTGLTAYFGLLRVGQPKASDVVLVSGAAGATGSMVAQIAKHVTRCRLVIGTAGSDKKCDWLLQNQIVDVAINYKTCQSLSKAISQACRKHQCKGVDLVFDNVGSTFLEAALSNLALGATIVLCGAISQYNVSNAANTIVGPRNYMNLLVKRATMTGFVVLDYKQEFQEAIGQLMEWIAAGKIRCYQEDMTHSGISNFYPALLSLFEGTNVGKVVLRVQNGDGESKSSSSSSSCRSKL